MYRTKQLKGNNGQPDDQFITICKNMINLEIKVIQMDRSQEAMPICNNTSKYPAWMCLQCHRTYVSQEELNFLILAYLTYNNAPPIFNSCMGSPNTFSKQYSSPIFPPLWNLQFSSLLDANASKCVFLDIFCLAYQL